MRYFLILVFILSGCAAIQPEQKADSKVAPATKISVTGTRISKETFSKKKVVGQMSGRKWLAYGGVSNPMTFILQDIDAPKPEGGEPYQDIEATLVSKGHKVVEKTSDKLVIERQGQAADYLVTVTYIFIDGLFSKYEIK